MMIQWPSSEIRFDDEKHDEFKSNDTVFRFKIAKGWKMMLNRECSDSILWKCIQLG